MDTLITSQGTPSRMNDSWAAVVQLVGVQFALVSAVIHLWWGFPRLLVYLPIASFADPRPYLFVISGVAIGISGSLRNSHIPDCRFVEIGAGDRGCTQQTNIVCSARP